jgi:putative holliday junction resolvase
MRILAVDPGEKNIGIAISDPSGTIATPLTTIRHVSRPVDAAMIAQLAAEHQAVKIIIGQALDSDNNPTFQGRKAARLASATRTQTDISVELWDESGSTLAARQAMITMNAPRTRRKGHHDALAATYILQTYLDAHAFNTNQLSQQE